ncbi:putative bifunctional diguanylate cyclase/phosphodiesterase [Oxynema aestuarii]|uniref:EAL domain-containing protein n=1 Tax=Oxynema aestuarii AP17 TaxID=2064643 RepID=A0A6H1TT59_9CYAN|nr:EAL domain-containing response regulator [Oxynema aestuarii]QIZ69798.1 EAL domain-containing protein [Oxynema aestuarii AP17]
MKDAHFPFQLNSPPMNSGETHPRIQRCDRQAYSHGRIEILSVEVAKNRSPSLYQILEDRGYRVTATTEGELALSLAQELVPDLILLAVDLPDSKSYEICRQLKEDIALKDIPVLFVIPASEPASKSAIFEVGAADYLLAPFEVREVLSRVDRQLELIAAKREIMQLNIRLYEQVDRRAQRLPWGRDRRLNPSIFDPLTQLPMRLMFLEYLEAALGRKRIDPAYSPAVLFLECDRFKVLNNSFGHDVGDRLLVEIARRIQPLLTQNDVMARLGGDEFALFLDDLQAGDRFSAIADRILEVLAQPFLIQGYEIFIHTSIGIAIGDRDYQRAEHWLRDADTAMFRAKSLGKGRYQLFDPSMYASALQFLQLEADLRHAIERNEFQLYYQPIVSLTTGKIVGFEALLRWPHPTRGLVSPVEFIPIAEETGSIVALDRWVLREACQQLSQWQTEGLIDEKIAVSVNFSARQFSQPDLIEYIDRILTETQLDPRCLKLEITESAIMENTESAAAILRQLRDRHIHLSIDDFGTGYSSLSYLHHFPVDTIKVDKSFVQRLDGSPHNLGLIPAIISIAQTMGMSVIAEGIETVEQLTQLRALKCNYSQGFLFSQPLKAQEAIALLTMAPQW